MTGGRTTIWEPSADQVALLRAALWPDERGLAAWRRWRRSVARIDAVEPGAYRLLPLVYVNLGPLLEGDPDRDTLKGVFRQSWARNQAGLRIGRRALLSLRDAGVETLVLKGGALIVSAYAEEGSRPMGDLDVAVPSAAVDAAVAALRGAGFEPVGESPERLLRVRHSVAFRDGDQEVDLHSGVLWRRGLDREFWAASVPIELAGTATRCLCPADQLLHVCVHGAAWNPVQPIRWVVDAQAVIGAAGSGLDWERLVAMADRGRLRAPLRDALVWLREELEAPVPAAVLTGLGGAVSRAELRAHAAVAQPPSVRRSLAMTWWFWERYRAQASFEGRLPTPLGLVRYLQRFWGLASGREVLGYAAGRLTRGRGRAGRSD